MPEPEQDILPEIYGRILAELPAVARQSVVALLVAQNGELRQHATGTLVQFADERFLVTAAHAVREALEFNCMPLFMANGAESGAPLPIEGDILYTPKTQPHLGVYDGADLAVYRLFKSTWEQIEGKIFLTSADIATRYDLSEGIFYLCGFPCVWTSSIDEDKYHLRLPAWNFLTHAYKGATDHIPNYSARYHVLFDASAKDTRSVDGIMRSLPSSLQGISGCSVWKAHSFRRDDAGWKSSHAKVVAVQTSFYTTTQVIKATRWIGIMSMIGQAFPRLVPGFNLVLKR